MHGMTTCTIGPSAVTGERCGKPAVHTFIGSDGETYAECADHVHIVTKAHGHNVGDHVAIRRYGKTFDGVVTRVARTGTAYATFTYGNGTTRTVRVED